jgi:LacI family transcriptional regulator
MANVSFVRVADVAARAGVSSGTVSNYFHNPARVADATAERIRGAIEELGYVPNDAARSLRRRETKTIGHLAFEVANPYSAEFVHAADREARALGYVALNVSSEGDPQLQTELLDIFARQRVDGVIMTPVGDAAGAAKRLTSQGIPVVFTDSVEGFASAVSFDDVAGGRLAGEHLVEIGHRRLAFVGDNPGINIIERRLHGLRGVVEKTPGASLTVIHLDERSISSGRSVGEKLAAMDPRQRPTGIVAVNDLVAVGILNAVYGTVGVPEEMGIIGFDDIDFASGAVVPLTSVRRPVHALAERAVQMLHRAIQHRDEPPVISVEMLESSLAVRGSTVRSPRE